jgi:hypothetical protein
MQVLGLRNCDMAEVAAGGLDVSTLMSVDVDRICGLCISFHDLWG